MPTYFRTACYKKFTLAVVEGDYALSANDCGADEIPAAQLGRQRVGVARGAMEGSEQKLVVVVVGCWKLFSV